MFQDKLRRLMAGRYGMDQLNMILLLGGMLLSLLGSLTGWWLVSLLSLGLLGWALYRMFSRNCNARYLENQRFLPTWNRLDSWAQLQRRRWRDRKSYRYFRCPSCNQTLRVPKGKGKIRITCPKCKTELLRKT